MARQMFRIPVTLKKMAGLSYVRYFLNDQAAIEALATVDVSLREKLHGRLPYTKAAIAWAVQEEMCMTVDDALARRTRALLLDARAAREAAPAVAALMAKLMHKDKQWQEEQVTAFNKIAFNYIPQTTPH